ncbi:methyl-accepting chemotaxis protein [Vitreimonas sp.]|uniref:methyl-accepting chemotaxis protein n=1 Tax=Vitreimonas sp. TaxID=3069702 RepID=UPI002ED8C217
MLKEFLGRRQLATKITLAGASAVALFIAVGSGTAAWVVESTAVEGAQETADIAAGEAASEVEAQFERPIGLAAAMRDAISAAQAAGIADREVHNRLMRETLIAHNELLGTWTGWEPNAFDGRDSDYIGANGHDGTGRFVPYWHRAGSDIAIAPLESYTVPGDGDYYQLAFNSHQPVLIEPYVYPVNGVDTLITSVALPIMRGDSAYGVAGVDIALDKLQESLNQMDVPFDGRLSVISGNGLYIYHPDSALLGQSAGEIGDIQADVQRLHDEQLGDIMRIERAIQFADFNVNWRVRVDLPVSAVMANARLIEMVLLFSALAMIAGLAFTLKIAAGRIVGRPLQQLSDDMSKIAQGDLAMPPPRAPRADEVGKMQEAVDVFRQNAIDRVRLEGEAAAQRRQAEEERARNDAERQKSEAEQRTVVEALADGLAKLAKGDLRFAVNKPFAGQYEQLRKDFNAAIAQLREAMSVISMNSDGIRSGAGEISQAADDLSRRTEQQAASLEETAAALDEITATVARSATGANKANETVHSAKANAEHGGKVVREAIEAMSEIEESSRQITQIIGVIDEIAFQTNLLALNAGVEAARAGEAGRGFAVVAMEVRALAQRSAEAAKEIKSLIARSSEQVESGVARVGETGQALTGIVSQVAEISALVGEIATSAQEQATALVQINAAINHMDQATQQNAAMVEQSTAASHSLAREADELASLVARFELGDQMRERSAA